MSQAEKEFTEVDDSKVTAISWNEQDVVDFVDALPLDELYNELEIYEIEIENKTLVDMRKDLVAAMWAEVKAGLVKF
jgi:hypothetical protein